MAVTEKNITSTGATSYTFEFEYLKTADVKVSVNGTATTQFTVPNGAPTTVQFNSGHVPASGAAIRIYRDTDVDTLSATFYAGSAIKSQDLNDNFSQNLYVTQEAKRDVASAWQGGDETIDSTETWVSNNERVATTGAIDGRVDAKIDTALTNDIVGGDRITVTDNSPGSGQVTIKVTPDSIVNADVNSSAAIAQSKLNIADATTSASGYMSGADKTKLNGIETAATADQTNAEIRTAVEAATDSNVFTDADHSKLNAIEASATADQTDAEIRAAVEAASDSNVFTDADHSKLNAIEANATADQTASEIKTLYESNAETNALTDAEKQVIDGVTSNTSELNKLDGYTGSTNDLNIVSGKSFKTSSGTLDTTSDTEIPSSKVIAAHVASSQTAIGGFITIADEVSFPITANMPTNGVVVSINNAAGIVVNGSGVSTTGRTTDGTPATVTINNFPSSLNGETLAAGVGLMVTATSTSNTYNYHKILAAETDVKQLSDDINDFNARYRVASSAPGSSNDAGDMYFDTSANKMKVYNGTTNAWDDVASVGSFYVNTISSSSGTGGGSATFNGSAYRFTLSNAGTSAQQHIVSVNGVIQKPSSGTSQPSEGFALSGNDIIFSAAPASGSDSFIITCGSSVSIGTPSANSVNSSHIIDGSIVNGDISNSANIAGSKVADDSIPEVKLDVHNAPATGKYLKYTSNGMEWSDGASEGTDVKSTGESGTTKFLRVDGDGTCSWQVPPVTDISGKANLSGATFTGDITIDNSTPKLLMKVTDDAQSVRYEHYNTADAIVSRIYGASDGELRLETGTNGNQKGVVVKPAGAVEAYHNNNKKLETTSSGINVTGQINVNGSPLSAAPEITATASGAIGSEKSLLVNTNGTISEVGTIAATVGNPVTSQTGNSQNYHRLLYWEGNKYIYGRQHGPSGTLKVQVITINANNSLSFGSELDYGTLQNNYMEPYSFILNYDKDTLYTLQQYNTSGHMNYAINSLSGTTISAASANGIVNNSGAMSNMAQFKQANGTMSFFYKRGQNSTMAYRGMNTSGPNSGPTTMISSVNNSWGNFTSCYIPWLDKNLLFYRNSSAEGFIRMVNMNSSAGYQSMGTAYQIASGGWGDNHYNTWSRATPSFAVDTVNQRVAFFYQKNNAQSDQGVHYRIITSIASNGSMTVGAKQTVTTNISRAIHADYDSANNQFVMVYNDNSDSDKGKMFKGTSASPALTNTSTTTFQSASDIYPENDRTMAFAMGSNGGSQGLIAFTNNTSGNNTRNFQVYNGESTNLTSENFVGFAKSGVSNGQSVTAKVTGNTSTQSSLTAGQKYYVQKDGTLGLTPVSGTSVEAGLALSSTKLLIKG